jgi:hypothetical protein
MTQDLLCAMELQFIYHGPLQNWKPEGSGGSYIMNQAPVRLGGNLQAGFGVYELVYPYLYW